MFGAIIGIAAKVIGGAMGAGGAGGILGSIGGGGGLLSSLFQGGPLKEIFDMVSKFKSDFLGGADQQPPLGNFGQRDNLAAGGGRRQERLLDRIDSLLDRLERLRGEDQTNETEGGCQCDNSTNSGNSSIDRIRELLRQLVGTSSTESQASFQITRSQFLNIQV